MGKRIGYVRVSSILQSTERQLDGVQVDRLFTDKVSGKDLNRPELQKALMLLDAGDTLVVHSPDRLARNAEDLLRIVRELTSRGVTVQFVKGETFTPEGTSPMSKLMLTMLAAFAEFERNLIRERQREGIAIAKAKGDVYKGRVPTLSQAKADELRRRHAEGWTKVELAKEYGISRTTVYEYLGKAA